MSKAPRGQEKEENGDSWEASREGVKVEAGDDEEVWVLERLSLFNVSLQSQANLPPLGWLCKQVLSDSRFCGGLEVLAEWAPGLSHLRLSCNPIKDTGALKPLEKLKGLQNLELFGFEESQQLR
ncbi:acidic leucine-rich nuclear phosphoprotein 32 family member A-like [Phocoena phocoena]|uniref:acidic leucine-rich nuclear phosphoprotein 32 family member A-like n=1 Tax=Phocoena phocoena TaxID=9742 RepID=UPI0033072832